MAAAKVLSVSPIRLGLLVGVPAIIVIAFHQPLFAAVSLKTWNDGDTINAADLNANFDSVKTELATFEGTAMRSGRTIVCTATQSVTNGVGPFSHTFAANECGGTLPDSTYLGLMSSWTATCNGWSHGKALQSADTAFPGFSGYWDFSGCTGTNTTTASVVYVKK